ncbi:MAG: hypothetical protein VKM01_05800 [Cyanobacteriota bacterium]|nr:hypothetical protein [Cyanobacteriota bacterium]
MRFLAAAWLAQLLLAGGLTLVDPIPRQPLLVVRRACAEAPWAALVERYSRLHRQHLLRQRQFSPVVEVSVFGEVTSAEPPPPERFTRAAAVGELDGARLADLHRRFPRALVLRCEDGAPL